MTRDQESQLLDRYERGCREAESELVRGAHGYSVWLSRHFSRRPEDQEELYAVGMIAAWRALKTYKRNAGCRYLSYACNSMRWRMQRHLTNMIEQRTRFKPSALPLDVKHNALTPDKEAVRNECIAAMREAVSTLAPRQQVVAREMMDGTPAPTIGRKLGLSAARVKQLRKMAQQEIMAALPHGLGL